MALVFKDLDGHDVTLGDAIAGRPTLLLPADFTCKQICGPALSIAAGALGQTGLQPGRDYSLVVVGIDAQRQHRRCAALYLRPGRRPRRLRAQRQLTRRSIP